MSKLGSDMVNTIICGVWVDLVHKRHEVPIGVDLALGRPLWARDFSHIRFLLKIFYLEQHENHQSRPASD